MSTRKKESEASRYMQASEEELEARLEKARKALEALHALHALDGGSRDDTDAVSSLVGSALERQASLEDMVDRQKAMAELVHVVRMCEASLRIRELKRNKYFTQSAVRLLFDGERKKSGSWTDLFGSK